MRMAAGIIGGLLTLLLAVILMMDIPELSQAQLLSARIRTAGCTVGGYGLPMLLAWQGIIGRRQHPVLWTLVWSLVGTLGGSVIAHFLAFDANLATVLARAAGYGIALSVLVVPAVTSLTFALGMGKKTGSVSTPDSAQGLESP